MSFVGRGSSKTPKSHDANVTPHARQNMTNGAVDRAEQVLLRGTEIREQIQARCDSKENDLQQFYCIIIML